MTSGRRPDGNQSAYFDELLQRIRQVPGVSAAAGAVTLPIGGDDFGTRLAVEGQPSPPPGTEPRIGTRSSRRGGSRRWDSACADVISDCPMTARTGRW